jgi:hypothetical protein
MENIIKYAKATINNKSTYLVVEKDTDGTKGYFMYFQKELNDENAEGDEWFESIDKLDKSVERRFGINTTQWEYPKE